MVLGPWSAVRVLPLPPELPNPGSPSSHQSIIDIRYVICIRAMYAGLRTGCCVLHELQDVLERTYTQIVAPPRATAYPRSGLMVHVMLRAGVLQGERKFDHCMYRTFKIHGSRYQKISGFVVVRNLISDPNGTHTTALEVNLRPSTLPRLPIARVVDLGPSLEMLKIKYLLLLDNRTRHIR
ncbi:hypothetical protein C8R48DRAFT_762926 [Suillus tomentosus]|nr:hypothetical protein C8R48DRAFT_762926 [Suillus tomentosus]